nr:hypothetical protein [Bacteroidota bacterium]
MTDETGRLLPPDHIDKEYYRFIENYPPDNFWGDWDYLGPSDNGTVPGYPDAKPGLGRLSCIAFHPTNPNIIYVGAPGGGIWKTVSGGNQWQVMNPDQFARLGVSSIAINPENANIIYIGTGDRDSNSTPGRGVFKSTDGGVSWTQITNGMGDREVNKLLIKPGDPETLIAGTNYGIFVTTDGGLIWNRKNYICVHDLLFKPGNPEYIYASSDGCFLRSINGGDTWNSITSGLRSAERGAIGVSPQKPERVYFFTERDGRFEGFYVSNNSGGSFNRKDVTAHEGEKQGSYNLEIGVDPNNADIIYTGMVHIYRSLDGGNSFSKFTTGWETHADQHAFEFSPINDKMYIANDGGLYYHNGDSVFVNLNESIAISAIYYLDVSTADPTRIIMGLQDCGSRILYGGNSCRVLGSDGLSCQMDPGDHNIMYGTAQHGPIRRIKVIDPDTDEYIVEKIGGKKSNGIIDSAAWEMPFTIDHSNHNRMYAGFKDVWRSTNIKASPANDVTWENISAGKIDNVQHIRYVEQSPANSNILYISKNSAPSPGKMYRSITVNSTNPIWYELYPPVTGEIEWIEAHPTRSDEVYIVANRRIFKSTTTGALWLNITGNLPNIPLRSIAILANGADDCIFVGTAAGVYYKYNSMTEWRLFKNNLPLVDVRAMKIVQSGGTKALFAATYGRGIWKTSIPDNYHPNLTVFTGAVNNSGNDLEIIAGVLNDESQTIAENFSVGYYLSTNEIISRSDYLIGEELVPILYSGVYLSSNLQINMAYLPKEISKGTYYAGAIVDYSDQVPETDEYDNIWHSGETVEIHVPYQPQSIQATDGDLPYVTVTWEPPPNLLGYVYYRVYRAKTNNTGYADRLGDAWQPGLIFHDYTADGGTNYYYWVKACYNPDGFRPGALGSKDAGWAKLSPPIDVQASQGTYESRIKITWEAVPASTHFRVYRNMVNDLETAESLTWNWSSVCYYNDNTAQPGQQYYYWVRSARSPTGYRASPGYSEIASGYRAWADAPDATATKGTFDSKIDITWNAVPGATYYRVYRNDENSPSGASPVTDWQTGLSYSDFTATQGEYYYYWVKAANNPSGTLPTGFGEGDVGWRRLSAPPNLIASDGEYEEYVYLVWSTPPYANSYVIYRSEYSGYGYAEEIASGITGWEYYDDDVERGKTYYYWVKATKNSNNDFLSDFSPEDSGWEKLLPSIVTATKGVYPWRVNIDWTPVEGAYLYKVSFAPVAYPQNVSVIMDWNSQPLFHLEQGLEGQYTPYFFTVEASRDYSYENPSEGIDIGFSGECGNLADVAEYRQSEMNGTSLTINHRIINNGAWPTNENARIVYHIKPYPGGDDNFEVGDAWVSALGVGQYANISHSFNLLNCTENVPIGEYTIVYQLNVDEDVCENDETDNFIEWSDMTFEYTNAMYGIYTIGGDEPDYENFNDAVADITTRGISDSVTFYVRPGIYSEQITISSIDGTSESKWITFMGDPSRSDTAVITYTDNEDNYVINLQGATYINIQNLKLISEGYSNYESTYGRVITLSDCYYINIRNNRIIGVNDPVYLSDENAVIFAQNSLNQFVTFNGNEIEKGSYGIFFIGYGLGDDLILGTNISNN